MSPSQFLVFPSLFRVSLCLFVVSPSLYWVFLTLFWVSPDLFWVFPGLFVVLRSLFPVVWGLFVVAPSVSRGSPGMSAEVERGGLAVGGAPAGRGSVPLEARARYPAGVRIKPKGGRIKTGR